jgi:hypothetical protein
MSDFKQEDDKTINTMDEKDAFDDDTYTRYLDLRDEINSANRALIKHCIIPNSKYYKGYFCQPATVEFVGLSNLIKASKLLDIKFITNNLGFTSITKSSVAFRKPVGADTFEDVFVTTTLVLDCNSWITFQLTESVIGYPTIDSYGVKTRDRFNLLEECHDMHSANCLNLHHWVDTFNRIILERNNRVSNKTINAMFEISYSMKEFVRQITIKPVVINMHSMYMTIPQVFNDMFKAVTNSWAALLNNIQAQHYVNKFDDLNIYGGTICDIDEKINDHIDRLSWIMRDFRVFM